MGQVIYMMVHPTVSSQATFKTSEAGLSMQREKCANAKSLSKKKNATCKIVYGNIACSIILFMGENCIKIYGKSL